MKKNMGSADKITRLILAAILVVLYFTNTITGTLGIIALILAAVCADQLYWFLPALPAFRNQYL